ncbi:hypothetical protein O6P43_005376 [Quillaja saponaria]|uniref:Uncharacterized protein n=1 Tax=Quillaja saponaria TaxID=32244 RepID=A0AAD7Q612_QUISA|nr:hypothetical protein O6P43_005376 [Quillaja saponaria]
MESPVHLRLRKVKNLGAYNLVFCPRLDVPTLCKGLGIHKSGFLALGDDIKPFHFVFQKSPKSYSSSKIYSISCLTASAN